MLNWCGSRQFFSLEKNEKDWYISKSLVSFAFFLIGAYICSTKEIRNDIDTTSKMEG